MLNKVFNFYNLLYRAVLYIQSLEPGSIHVNHSIPHLSVPSTPRTSATPAITPGNYTQTPLHAAVTVTAGAVTVTDVVFVTVLIAMLLLLSLTTEIVLAGGVIVPVPGIDDPAATVTVTGG